MQLYETYRIAGAPTWCWSWEPAVTSWNTSTRCRTAAAARGWERRGPAGCSGSWAVLWPTATARASCTGEGAAPPAPTCRKRPTRARDQHHFPFPCRELKCENILLDYQGLLKLTREPVAQPHPLPWTP